MYQKKHLKQIRLLISGLVLLIGPVCQSRAATWIEYYEGSSNIYKLERNDKPLPVAIYKELHKGDQISVKKKGFSLWLKQDDGNLIVINRDNSPFQVKDAGKVPGILGRLIEYAGEFLGLGLEDGSARPPIVILGTRGLEDSMSLPLAFPLAPSGRSRLASGSRQFHLFWQGGASPFSLRLGKKGDVLPIFDINSLSLPNPVERRVSLGPLQLSEGQYELKIASRTHKIIINLDVVAWNALPTSPAGIGPNERDAIKANVYAFWLASHSEEWVLEAYQRARAIGAMHKPAKLLQYSLENGRRPVRGE